jgi:hypothetical protein
MAGRLGKLSRNSTKLCNAINAAIATARCTEVPSPGIVPLADATSPFTVTSALV